jgi:hypothetical protein
MEGFMTQLNLFLPDKLYKLKEVSEIMQGIVCKSTINRLAKEGKILSLTIDEGAERERRQFLGSDLNEYFRTK